MDNDEADGGAGDTWHEPELVFGDCDAEASGGEDDTDSREIDYPDESSGEDESDAEFGDALGAMILGAIQQAVAGVDPALVAVRGGEQDPAALGLLQGGDAQALGLAAMLAGEVHNRRREEVVGPTYHEPLMPYLNYCEVVRDARDAGFAALEDRTCTVCQAEMSPGAELVCKMPGRAHEHYFHVACLEPWLNPQDGEPRNSCPTCRGVVHRVTGPQPPGGTVTLHEVPEVVPEGFSRHECPGALRLDFTLPAGCTPDGRMHAGLRAQGSHCFLPATEDGRELARLVVRAWEQRLLFRVADDGSGRVVLNGIELKHALCGGGVLAYPDANYPFYLRDKLKSLGIE